MIATSPFLRSFQANPDGVTIGPFCLTRAQVQAQGPVSRSHALSRDTWVMRGWAVFVMSLVLLASTSCLSTEPTRFEAAQARRDMSGDWILRAVTIDGVKQRLPVPIPHVSITQSNATFEVGCADFRGEVEASSSGSLSFPNLQEIRNICRNGVPGFPILSLMESMSSWERTSEALTLSGGATVTYWTPLEP